MSNLILTPESEDFFLYTQNPLPAPWSIALGAGLQGLDGYAEAASTNAADYEAYAYTLPSDHYVSAQIKTIVNANNPRLFLCARSSAPEVGYQVLYYQNALTLYHGIHPFYNVSPLTLENGDTLTIACIGQTIFLLQNGVTVGQIDDSQYVTGGGAFLGMQVANLTDLQVENFTVGSGVNPASQFGGYRPEYPGYQAPRPQPAYTRPSFYRL
jgi:hypothetical protein